MTSAIATDSQLLVWDEYRKDRPKSSDEWARTDRGWARFSMDEYHPDHGKWGADDHCGWYLDYEHGERHVTDGRAPTILASAYLLRPGGVESLGHHWCWTIDGARHFIRDTVSSALIALDSD